ncbi:MAG: WG repeat-containing protein [Muribaculaceae bacterium]|nr:WG repeat-containing protein [Muribaculaceae bacterium]
MKPIKTCYSTLAIVAIALASVSCQESDTLEIEALPYQAKEDGSWGMVSIDNRHNVEPEYKNFPTVASDGLYWVRNNRGYWELYSLSDGRSVNEDEYRYATLFRNGKAIVTKRDEDVTLINKKGEQIADFSKIGKYKPDQFSGFNGIVALFTANDKTGLCNMKGEVVVKPVYSMISNPTDGKLIATDSIAFNQMVGVDEDTTKIKGNRIVFDYKGEELLKLPRKKYYEVGERFYGDFLAVGKKVDGQPDYDLNWGIINSKGEEVVKPSQKYKLITAIGADYFIYSDGDNYGVMSFTGDKILAPKYSYIEQEGDYFITTSRSDDSFDFEDTDVRLYDTKGEQIIGKKYHNLTVIGKTVFAQLESDRWDMLNLKGERIDDAPRIYSIASWSTADEYVSTDKIDINRFVKNLDFSATMLDGITFSTGVQDALKVQAATYSATNTPKAADYNHTDEVRIYRRIDGTDVTEVVKYPGTLSHQTYREQQVIDFWYGYTYYYHINKVPTGYAFSTAKPKWLAMEFNNYGIMRGKLKTLYKALCSRFASMGTEADHCSSATSYTLPDGKYAIVYILPNSVVAKWGDLSSTERNIYQYSGNKEDLSVVYEEMVD